MNTPQEPDQKPIEDLFEKDENFKLSNLFCAVEPMLKGTLDRITLCLNGLPIQNHNKLTQESGDYEYALESLTHETLYDLWIQIQVLLLTIPFILVYIYDHEDNQKIIFAPILGLIALAAFASKFRKDHLAAQQRRKNITQEIQEILDKHSQL